MADAWLPEAVRLPARQDGGALRGGAPRAVWLTSESDPRAVSAWSVAADLAKSGRPAHLVWNPVSGEAVQLIPIVRAARALAGDAGGDAGGGGGAVGREGRVCAQIMVVGHARDPFTNTLLTGLDPIMRWLDAWGVARRWPAGPPLPIPASYEARRERRAWARGGHYGASQVPGEVRPDPGGIDVRRVTGTDTPLAPIPRPRPAPPEESPLSNGGPRKPLLTRKPATAAAVPQPVPASAR
ncbi:hypothetical protein [Actinomadura rupiterrae]|uniref:hypothetical protein n=1 Tax=Actinomadura rupiterrae TaxID=559627 RepID=UPI0020A52BED|nr:hypothetical protein [Actinomadura rupiterrae]MCP2334686.1 hypothetical protein [Actinomadura rupiterrae]